MAGLLVLAIFSCNKNNPKATNYQTATITYVLANSANTTLFKAAITQAGLDSTLAGTGPFTLFVPTDDAMAKSGYNITAIAAMSTADAKNLVLYHTVAGTALAGKDLIGKKESRLITANGDSVFITSDSNSIWISGVPVALVDLVTANGILHATGGVLTAPDSSLAQAIAADTALTFMQAALQHATATPDSLSSRLAGGSVYTVFAPVNDAFRALGYQKPTDLASASGDSLRQLLLAHFIPQRLMSYDLSDSATFLNANNSTLVFDITGLITTLRMSSSDSLSAVTVLSQDYRAYNGVLFKVSGVLR